MPRKKQSFIQTLAKGFVRSAVNQVGRDSGRLVSNKFYKGAHATPVNLQQTTTPPPKPAHKKKCNTSTPMQCIMKDNFISFQVSNLPLPSKC